MSRRLVFSAVAAFSLMTTGCMLPDGVLAPSLSGGSITSLRTNLNPAKTSVSVGESIALWIETNLPASGQSYSWSATSGSLSSTSDQQVSWTATELGTARITCVVSSGTDSKQAEYRFTVR